MNYAAEVVTLLGLVLLLVAMYVFTAAARSYVSEDASRGLGWQMRNRPLWRRRHLDRRRGGEVCFPIVVDGTVVASDRRLLPDRRQASG